MNQLKTQLRVINLEVAEVVETEVLVEVLDQADLVEISQATEEVVAVEMPTVQVELELQSDQPEIEEQAVEIQVADQPGKVHQDLVLASQELAELETSTADVHLTDNNYK